jgi:Proteasome subunit
MSSNQRTTRPITTGTSVIGLVYDGGVMIAADTLLSYGSMAKSFNTPRLYSIEDRILLGASGEYSDLQEIVAKVKALALQETTNSMESIYVDRKLPAKSLWNYLRAVMYQKRSKMNPYWNDVVVAGWDDQAEKPFLGTVDPPRKLGGDWIWCLLGHATVAGQVESRPERRRGPGLVGGCHEGVVLPRLSCFCPHSTGQVHQRWMHCVGTLRVGSFQWMERTQHDPCRWRFGWRWGLVRKMEKKSERLYEDKKQKNHFKFQLNKIALEVHNMIIQIIQCSALACKLAELCPKRNSSFPQRYYAPSFAAIASCGI